MTDIASSATVATDRPQRYGKQLVAHLGRRAEGSWDDESGSGQLVFGDSRARLSSTPGALLLEIAADSAELDRVEDVVGRHLVRFGARDELAVDWVRADGTPGTRQRNTED